MEQSTPVVQMKGSIQDSVWTAEFDMKHPKKTEGYIGRKVVSITKDEVNSLNILRNNNRYRFSNRFIWNAISGPK